MGAQGNSIRIDTSLDRVTDWMGDVVRTTPLVEKRGRVSAVTGGLIRATVTGVRIADLCMLSGVGGAAHGDDVLAEDMVESAMTEELSAADSKSETTGVASGA